MQGRGAWLAGVVLLTVVTRLGLSAAESERAPHGRVTLSPAELRGGLTDASGRPLSGIRVEAFAYKTPFVEAVDWTRGAPDREILGVAVTDTQGRFRLRVEGSEAGAGVRLRAWGAGAVPTWLPGIWPPGGDADLGTHRLAEARTLSGRVVTPAGDPDPDALVRLASAPDAGTLPSVPRWTVTDGRGRFRFDDAQPDDNEITVHALGFAPARRAGVRAAALGVPIGLERGIIVEGRLRGRPKGAPVLVRFEADAASTAWVEVDDKGRFAIPDAPRGPGMLVADAGELGRGVTPLRLPGDAERSIELTLSPPARLEGRALDAAQGDGVSGVRVVVETVEGPWATISGTGGGFEITGARPGRAGVRAWSDHHAPWRRDDVELRPDVTRLDIALLASASMSGQVVDEEGGGIAGAEVRVLALGDEPFAAARRFSRAGPFDVRSGKDGRFVAARLEPGPNQLLTVRHPGYAAASVTGLHLEPGEHADGLLVVLHPGRSLMGRVVDVDEAPVPGAEVELDRSRTVRGGAGNVMFDAPLGEPADRRPRATTGAEGSFEFPALADGQYGLTVRCPGFARTYVERVLVGPDAEPVAVRLPPGVAIAGRVVTPDGRGVEGASVWAAVRRGRLSGEAPERTDSAGSFRVEELAAGATYAVVAFTPDGRSSRSRNVTPPAEDLRLELPGTGFVSGRAFDAVSRAPLTAFDVSCQPGPGRMPRRYRRDEGWRRVLSEEGAFRLDDVAAGTCDLELRADGYQDARVAGVEVEAGLGTTGLEVRARRGTTLTGRVRAARSQRPVADASIQIQGGDTEADGWDPHATPDATTDGEGSFEARGLAPGAYTVVAEHPRYARGSRHVEVAPRGASVELELDEGANVAGVVLDDGGVPVSGIDVFLGAKGSTWGDWSARSSTTDAVGAFRFDHVAPGSYAIAASGPGGRHAEQDVVVRSDESQEDVRLQFPSGATVRGVVRGLPAERLGSVEVSVVSAEHHPYWATCTPDGAFSVAGVPEGAFNVRAFTFEGVAGSRLATAQGVVGEGQSDVSVEVVFPSGATLSGTVRRDQAPVAEAWVRAAAADRTNWGHSLSDAEGAYRIEGLSDGPYVVSVSSEDGSYSRENVEVFGDTTFDVDLPVGRLTGTVRDTEGDPLSEVTVELESRDAQPRIGHQAVSDSDGRFAIRGMADGTYTLSASRSGFATLTRGVDFPGDGAPLEIALTPASILPVHAVDGRLGVPLRGLQVAVLSGNGPASAFEVPLDDLGRGEVSALGEGSYTLAVEASGYAPVGLTVGVPGPSLELALTPGGSLEIHAGPQARDGGGAVLRLLDPAGRAQPLSAWPGGDRTRLTTSIRFLQHVVPGTYVLEVAGVRGDSVTVTEGRVTSVEVP